MAPSNQRGQASRGPMKSIRLRDQSRDVAEEWVSWRTLVQLNVSSSQPGIHDFHDLSDNVLSLRVL
jgi:hypothetical protein